MLGAKFFHALVNRSSDGVANFVQQSADDRPLFRVERFHSIAPRGNAAVASEIAHAHGLERLRIGRRFNFAQSSVA
ncbi:MAG TPA: hypothetical protein DCO65_07650 [Spartobacteria bacterium]|nr:hypothetical protein [Spartobacteria bacterium]